MAPDDKSITLCKYYFDVDYVTSHAGVDSMIVHWISTMYNSRECLLRFTPSDNCHSLLIKKKDDIICILDR